MRLCAVAGTLSRLVRRLPAPLDELKTAAQLLLLTVQLTLVVIFFFVKFCSCTAVNSFITAGLLMQFFVLR